MNTKFNIGDKVWYIKKQLTSKGDKYFFHHGDIIKISIKDKDSVYYDIQDVGTTRLYSEKSDSCSHDEKRIALTINEVIEIEKDILKKEIEYLDSYKKIDILS
jgi:hypothetical protein